MILQGWTHPPNPPCDVCAKREATHHVTMTTYLLGHRNTNTRLMCQPCRQAVSRI